MNTNKFDFTKIIDRRGMDAIAVEMIGRRLVSVLVFISIFFLFFKDRIEYTP